MVDEQNVEGSVQNSSETPQVMNEQTVAPTPTDNQEVAQPQAETQENQENQVQEVVQPKIDPDEYILSDMFANGKTEVTTGELISAGFDTSRMAQYSFEVGNYRLSRLLLASPYKIEKKQ